jgi:hypothetical protein
MGFFRPLVRWISSDPNSPNFWKSKPAPIIGVCLVALFLLQIIFGGHIHVDSRFLIMKSLANGVYKVSDGNGIIVFTTTDSEFSSYRFFPREYHDIESRKTESDLLDDPVDSVFKHSNSDTITFFTKQYAMSWLILRDS